MVPRFLFHFLFSSVGQSQVLSSFQGAAIGGIPRGFARLTNVPIPPLPEQERIAKLLDAEEELRRLRAEADRRTADIIPAIFHEMFGSARSHSKITPLSEIVEVISVRNFEQVFPPWQTDSPNPKRNWELHRPGRLEICPCV